MIELAGFENLELCSQLIEKRELIQDQCRNLEENMKQEKNTSSYKPKNMDVNAPRIGVSVEIVHVKGKGKNRRPVNSTSQHQKQ